MNILCLKFNISTINNMYSSRFSLFGRTTQTANINSYSRHRLRVYCSDTSHDDKINTNKLDQDRYDIAHIKHIKDDIRNIMIYCDSKYTRYDRTNDDVINDLTQIKHDVDMLMLQFTSSVQMPIQKQNYDSFEYLSQSCNSFEHLLKEATGWFIIQIICPIARIIYPILRIFVIIYFMVCVALFIRSQF